MAVEELHIITTHTHSPTWSPLTQYSFITIFWLSEKYEFTLLKLSQNWSLMSNGVIYEFFLLRNQVNNDHFVLVLVIAFVFYLTIAIFFLQLTTDFLVHENFSKCSVTTNDVWCAIWTSRSLAWSTAGIRVFPILLGSLSYSF